MGELITEEQPRIKFLTSFQHQLDWDLRDVSELRHLSSLMSRMEALGAAPILNDGQVAGNCAISPFALQGPAQPSSADSTSSPSPSHQRGLALVSRSAKPPGHILDPARDFVLVTGFDRVKWAVQYEAVDSSLRPSSDSPLLVSALAMAAGSGGGDGGGSGGYGWSELPAVVLHGHALAEGEGLAYAAALGLPISPRATLFSTPEDLAELEALFRSHPYPHHRCYIRRGHGFFLLGRCVAEAEQLFDQLVVPWLLRGEGGRQGAGGGAQ